MIVVRVELHSAITGRVTELSRVIIDNVGGSRTRGDYRCRSYRKGTALVPPFVKGVVREGRVENHLREAEPVLSLVRKALAALDY